MFEIVSESGPGESLHFLENERLGAGQPNGPDRLGEYIAGVVKGVVLAAKRKGLARRPAGYKLGPILVGPEINSRHVAFGDVPSRDGLDAALLAFADRARGFSRCPRSVYM